MANRCPDCNKFVATEIEVDDCECEVDAESHSAHITVNLSKICAECGTELKTGTFEVDVAIPDWDKLLKAVDWEEV